ncbi:acetylglutamate kinase [Aliiglaciecola litoralis]|uniref:Acetylglutamate kinase n=1 Tax=Aliiglaciecola litoralis TaxID=582857 RepID=A0ABP3WZ55_9ALTE
MNVLVVKVGGAFLDDTAIASAFFEAIRASQQQIVLVHGGGNAVERLFNDLKLPSEKIDGLRVTPKSQIQYVVGALAGTVNKQLCALAQQAKLNPVGLSLFDGNMTQATKVSPQLGNVGSVSCTDKRLLSTLLSADYLPIISSIGADKDGELLNVNADQAAVVIAKLLGSPLVLLSDVAGVLDDSKALIPQLTHQHISDLIDAGTIKDGMSVKVIAALDAANAIGQPVHIASWRNSQLLGSLADKQRAFAGTTIMPDKPLSKEERKAL